MRTILLSPLLCATLAAQQQDELGARFGALAGVVEAHCIECHDDQSTKGALDLQARAAGAPVAWLTTLAAMRDRLRSGEMPPRDHDVPLAGADRARLVAFCEATLREEVPRLSPAPGRVTIRRLSRAEWEHTVADLFGVQATRATAFPQDDLGYGFDNIGDALSFSTLHLEKYLAAAEEVAAAVFHGENPALPPVHHIEGEAMHVVGGGGVDQGSDVANLYTNARVCADVALPRDGTYRLRIQAGATQAGDEPARMVVDVDGERLEVFAVPERAMSGFDVTTTLRGGSRRIAVAFVNDYFDPKHPDPERRDRNLRIDWIELTGPLDARITPPQQQWLVAADDPGRADAERLRRVLGQLLPRVWRRAVPAAELQRMQRLGQRELDGGAPFHVAAQRCLQAALVSPNFLFRVETGGAGRVPGPQLAVRLAYFLWSSAPDERTTRLGRDDRLHDPAVLAAEVGRLLADPRADRLATNFAAQWLELRALADRAPDPERFGGFDDGLRRSLRRQTELLFLAVLRDGAPVRTLLDCDFTYLDARLAKFYGVEDELAEQLAGGAPDEAFRRVSLPASMQGRGGVLGHASVHAVTSNPTRTSPVKRGKWILENLLGQAPPAPPPGNDSFPDEAAAATPQGLREQLALHRARPVCASCHVRMDALGFALENFDPVGRWRDRSELGEIDATAELPDGRRLTGLADLSAAIADDPAFVRTLARKLFVYAIGREPGAVDMLQLDHAVATLAARGPVTIADLVLVVARAPAFSLRSADR